MRISSVYDLHDDMSAYDYFLLSGDSCLLIHKADIKHLAKACHIFDFPKTKITLYATPGTGSQPLLVKSRLSTVINKLKRLRNAVV